VGEGKPLVVVEPNAHTPDALWKKRWRPCAPRARQSFTCVFWLRAVTGIPASARLMGGSQEQGAINWGG